MLCVCAFSCFVTSVLHVTGIIVKLLEFISSYMHTTYMFKTFFSYLARSGFYICLCPDCVAACLPLALIH